MSEEYGFRNRHELDAVQKENNAFEQWLERERNGLIIPTPGEIWNAALKHAAEVASRVNMMTKHAGIVPKSARTLRAEIVAAILKEIR